MKTLTTAALKARLSTGEKPQIVDVREVEEVKEGMIPGAKHLPMSHVSAENLQVIGIDPEKEIIFVCRSGNRSGYICMMAHSLGIQNPVNLEGGMMAW